MRQTDNPVDELQRLIHRARRATRWSDPHPLIGRDRERNWLQTEGEKAFSENLSMVCVYGPSGSGKSRLVKDVLPTFETREDALVLSGKCDENDPTPALSLKSALKSHINDIEAQSDDSLDDYKFLVDAGRSHKSALCAFYSEFYRIFDDASSFEVEGQARNRLLRKIAEFLSELAQKHSGLVLWLDDIQWMDQDTRRVLKLLTEDYTDCPLYIICTCRNDPDSIEILDKFRDEFDTHLERSFEVQPFGEDEVKELFRKELGGSYFDSDF
ncbi:MAG: AAA family ATPase [bacterium]